MKIFFLTPIFILFLTPVLYSEETLVPPLERRLQIERREGDNPWTIIPHRESYILPATFIANVNERPFRLAGRNTDLQETEAKFQLSFKYPLGYQMIFGRGTLYFAYTQIALWQVYNREESSPIRETNYEPEVFLSFKGETEILGLIYRLGRIGISHESNGREEGALSRSWNRITAEAFFDRGNFVMSLKPWFRIPERSSTDDNPGIERYMGYGELRVGYAFNKVILSALLRNNLRARNNKGALRLDLTFPLTKRVKGYIQYFTGYGETLIDYNVPVDRIGIGFLLADWI